LQRTRFARPLNFHTVRCMTRRDSRDSDGKVYTVRYDAVDATCYQTILALVYAWTGERGAALTQLEKIVRLPRGPDYGELRFNPWWDEIRDDPRFDRLLSQAALPPVYE